MALDDDDRAEIAALIAEASRSNPAPARGRRPAAEPDPGRGAPVDGDWDLMSPMQKQKWVRSLVEDQLASIDAEVEREDLRRENEELRQKVKDWEKAGKPGRRPTRESLGGGRPEEQTPTLVNSVYKFLFGDAKPTP